MVGKVMQTKMCIFCNGSECDAIRAETITAYVDIHVIDIRARKPFDYIRSHFNG